MRHFFFFVCFIVWGGAAFSKNYYVSAAGNNANDGLTTATAWQTIAKVNSSLAAMVAGDSVLFRSGDVFYGALVVNKSGSSGKPIVFSSYGTGNKPVISGFTTVSAWSLVSTGIYQATVSGAKSTLNLVTINNIPQALGRYPNAGDANGGYLSYEAFSGSTSITDLQLTASPSWTGAEAVIRKKLWILNRCRITGHSTSTLTCPDATNSDGTANWGYFFQDHARTLDQFGEWFLNKSTKQLQVYFGAASPAAYQVKASTIDTLVTINAKTFVTLRNLAFEGANYAAIYAVNSSYLNIINCDIRYSGQNGIYTQAVSNFTIDGSTTNHCLSNAIMLIGTTTTNITVKNCTVKNTGILAGMGLSGNNSHKAIDAEVGSTLLIEGNRVDTTGYAGIEFQGSNVTVRNNVVDYYNFVKDDAGGIYTWASGTDANPGPSYTNRVITKNVVMNGIGAPYGKVPYRLYSSGIYLDGRTMNVDVTDNTVFNVSNRGIHCNNPVNVTVKGNTSYNTFSAMSIARWSWGSIKNLTIKNNIFYPVADSQRHVFYVNSGLNEPTTTTLESAIKSMGTIDSNYYSNYNQAGFNYEVYPYTGEKATQVSPQSLEGWSDFSGFDVNASKPVMSPYSYTINSLVGASKFTNNAFTSNITGLTVFGTGVTATWDNTGKISGGSLRMNFSAPVGNRYGLLHGSIGATSAAKKYILRVTTVGTTQQGIIRAYIRKTASPYSNLTPIQTKSFTTARSLHEFLFDAPITDAGGSIVIEIEMNSGTTYLDNVEFYEANVTTYKKEDQLRFEYNDTKTAKNVTLSSNYVAVDGKVYSGTITLQPYTSLILVKDTSTVPPPPVTLSATATAPAISCFGGSVTATVAAVGGKSPYTGTGSFSVSAGTGSLQLSHSTATAGNYTLLYSTIGAISSTKNYILRFSTIRSAGTANIRAAIRQTNTPWTVITTKQTAIAGTSRTDHEFLFTAPASQSAASFLIEVEQTTGITYIDNVAFFEASATKQLLSANLYTNGGFDANITGVSAYSSNGSHTVSWNNTSKISAVYYYTIKDADGTTVIAELKTAQPAAALKATAVAGIVPATGTTTTVTVTGTGGTAPYTGTGTFTVGVGSYAYTVRDANGCSSTANVTVTKAAARPAATTTVGRATEEIAASDVALQLVVYPNPSNGLFNLQLLGGTAEKLGITVYSADGRIVHQAIGAGNSSYRFGSNFTPGVYVVKVVQGKTIQTLKLVKVK
ncbi:MAG: hypothetical protein RL172_2896 [Bacteroidota bacterium]